MMVHAVEAMNNLETLEAFISLELLNQLANRYLWRNRDQYVHMIFRDHSREYLYPHIRAYLSAKLTQSHPNIIIQNLFPILGTLHYVNPIVA